MTRLRQALLILCTFLPALPVAAHKPSDSYLRITGGGEQLTAQWDIALKDLDFLVGLDGDGDSQITWGELKAQRQAITDHAMDRLRIRVDGRDVQLRVTRLLVNRHSDGAYAALEIQSDAPGDADPITIHYDLLFDEDPTHRGLVLFSNGQVASTHVLTPTQPTLLLQTTEPGLFKALWNYTREGVWHIWIGFDHILFLISLLLPAVLVRKDNAWQPVEALRPASKEILKIVSMFTLAHSITLWLAVMEYVTLPGRLVEATIAFSIIVTAVNNLYPRLPLTGWAIAFCFGLIHGFGFANVLVDLGLTRSTLAAALLGFNVGVELGQLAIVAVFLPFAFLLRDTRFYRWVILRVGSALIIVIAALWMYERLFNTEIIGF